MSQDLAAHEWAPCFWAQIPCDCCREAVPNEFGLFSNVFLASEKSIHRRRCTQAVADTFAARDLLSERVVAYEAIAKSVLAELVHALRDGSEGLEAALGVAGAAVRVWCELEALDANHP
jgi:hypothetical protein